MSDQKKKGKKKGGMAKIGRSKRTLDSAMSLYVKGKIPFEKYAQRKGIKYKTKK